MSEKPLVLVADDGSGRVWIVEDGAGKAWFRPRAAADWVPLKDAKLAGAQDLYDHFASNDEVASRSGRDAADGARLGSELKQPPRAAVLFYRKENWHKRMPPPICSTSSSPMPSVKPFSQTPDQVAVTTTVPGRIDQTKLRFELVVGRIVVGHVVEQVE